MNASSDSGDHSVIDRVFRDEWSRVVAVLARSFRDLDLAEDAAQQAFAEAAASWPRSGVPDSPGAWITAVARRRAIDRIRRESVRDLKQHQAIETKDTAAWPDFDLGGESVDDDVLRLVFTCCHPALAAPSQVALTLRLVAGVETAAIAPRVPRARSHHDPATCPPRNERSARRTCRSGCLTMHTCPIALRRYWP